MNVVDLPQPQTHALYDEAMTRYAEMVQSRAISIYRVGNVRFPGLSDVDLLVVTDRAHIDNRYFFSAVQRLPSRYHPLFLHEPFVLPVWSLRVMRHTTHASPVLLAGREVLTPYAPSAEPDERWCRMLESYCSYAAFRENVIASGTLKGRLTVAVAGAFRYLLADAREAIGYGDADAYGREVDALRETFFERPDPAAAVREAWELFSCALASFEKALCERLALAQPAQAPAAARALLRGESESAHLDREYAFRRAQDIDGYHQELASLGLPFGHLFFIAAHPNAVHACAEPAVVENVVRNFYRVRRRLLEYARA